MDRNGTLLSWVAAIGVLMGSSGAQAIVDPITQYYNMTGVDAQNQVSNLNQTINGAMFGTGTNTTTVGTGVFSPFVRIQQNGEGNCTQPCIESGFNTDGTAQFETKDAGGSNWDHSLLLANVGTETINGQVYRTFVLDINEANNKSDRYLSLDKLQVYLGNAPDLDSFKEAAPDGSCTDNYPTCGLQGAAKLVYDMDDAAFSSPGVRNPNAVDRTVGLNYNLNNGSGKGIDLTVRILDSAFKTNGQYAGQYVYLYSAFGATGIVKNNSDTNGPPPFGNPSGQLPDGDYGQSAGFEEWSTRIVKVPEPVTLSLLLLGLTALSLSQRRHVARPSAVR